MIIYVGGSIPFNVWLIKVLLATDPRDLDENAMDGANKWQIFTKIILPLSVQFFLSSRCAIHGALDGLHASAPILDIKGTKENLDDRPRSLT